MAFTQTDLDRINRAIAQGAMTVEINGKRITYRTMSELLQAKANIENELAAVSGNSAPRQSFASFSRD